MTMELDCLFCRIIKGEIPSGKVYEDENVFSFKDIKPAAPVHVLVVPKRHVPALGACGPDDGAMLGSLMLGAENTAKAIGLEHYRIIINNGSGAGQTVFHLHVHILGGREMGERLL